MDGAVVQLLDAQPDGPALPGTPLGVFERRLLSGRLAAVGEPPPEPGSEQSRPRACRRGRIAWIRAAAAARLAFTGASAMGRFNGGTQAKARFIAAKRAHPAWAHTGTARCRAVADAGRDWRPRLARACFRRPSRRSTARWCKPIKSVVAVAELHRSLLAARDLNAIRQRNDSATAAAYTAVPAVAPFDAAGIRGAASRLLINRGLLQPALRREPELVDLPLGPADANGLAADGDEDHRAGRCGADGNREVPARFHALRRTRHGARTRAETAERIPRQPGASEIARCRPGSNS